MTLLWVVGTLAEPLPSGVGTARLSRAGTRFACLQARCGRTRITHPLPFSSPSPCGEHVLPFSVLCVKQLIAVLLAIPCDGARRIWKRASVRLSFPNTSFLHTRDAHESSLTQPGVALPAVRQHAQLQPLHILCAHPPHIASRRSTTQSCSFYSPTHVDHLLGFMRSTLPAYPLHTAHGDGRRHA